MFHDGAVHLEDVSHLYEDSVYKELVSEGRLPSADAIGDWLRRMGENKAGEKLRQLQENIFSKVFPENRTAEGVTLDIDATIITAEKGDAQKSYKGVRGYQPMLGVIEETGLVVGSQFRQGNISPQSGLWEFVKSCEKTYGQRIQTVRSDSAAYQKLFIENCMEEGKYFSITAMHTSSILKALKEIPQEQWQRGVEKDGIKGNWEVAETIHTFSSKKKTFRIVAKRYTGDSQLDFFADHRYWVVATNLPKEKYDSNAVVLFHCHRGEMERIIGEIKNQFGLKHLPCGQIAANEMYFSVGILAYNILQMIKLIALPPEHRRKSVRSLRYQLIHLAARLIYHARYAVVRIAAPMKNIQLVTELFLRLRFAPL